jgi:fatty acid desaturase
MCILADHDTFESAVENHVDGGEQDWGAIQVRHASDFATKGAFSRVFGELFGSINAQIGHHLYPSVNHVFLPELIPIIREACLEFDIPYASHDTLLGALLSVSKMVKASNVDALEKVKEW